MSLQRRCYKHKKGTVREVSWSGQMTWVVFPRTGQRRRGQWAGTVKEGLEPKHWFPPPELEYRVDDSSAVPGTSWVHFLLQVILSILLHPEGWAKGFTARFLAPSWLHATLRYDHKLHHFPSMEKAGEINHYPLWELTGQPEAPSQQLKARWHRCFPLLLMSVILSSTGPLYSLASQSLGCRE